MDYLRFLPPFRGQFLAIKEVCTALGVCTLLILGMDEFRLRMREYVRKVRDSHVPGEVRGENGVWSDGNQTVYYTSP